MRIQIDRKFSLRIKNVGWNEIKIAITEGWCNTGFAVDYAIALIENGNSELGVLELASFDYNSKFDILECLSRYEFDENESFNKSKWAKIMLTLGFERINLLEDPLLFIEEIYAEFDYPEDISHLVRYMPYERGYRDLMQEWKDFIETKVYDNIVLRP